MTELEVQLVQALSDDADNAAANKVYLSLFRSELYIPIHKRNQQVNDDADPMPMFIEHDGAFFLLAFDSFDKLQAWAGDYIDEIESYQTIGFHLIGNLRDNVYLCLNFGSEVYKEFPPDEIQQLKKMLGKLKQLRDMAEREAGESEPESI